MTEHRADPLTERIMANVATARKKRGLTAHQFANVCARVAPDVAMTRSMIASLESGRRSQLSVTEIVALAAALNVDPWSLTSESGPTCLVCNNAPHAGYRCLTCQTDGAPITEGATL